MTKAVPDRRRTEAYVKGQRAEHAAAEMLSRKGFKILSQRYRTRAGEIDIVAAKPGHLSFVEVKARRTCDEAAWSITPRQQRRIAGAAELWLSAFPDYRHHDMSFDAVLVAADGDPHYIPDAFRL